MPKNDRTAKAVAQAAKVTRRLPKGDAALHKLTGHNIARGADGTVITFGPYETDDEEGN